MANAKERDGMMCPHCWFGIYTWRGKPKNGIAKYVETVNGMDLYKCGCGKTMGQVPLPTD